MATLAATPDALPADIRLMNATAALLAAIGVVALLAAVVAWAAHRPVFAVRAIRIDGDLTHNSVLTIRANAVRKLQGNFFTMDLAAARRAFESVPWVRQAMVRRVWPNRLAVQLEEHRPAALWGGDTDEPTDKLVNSHGEVFEANLGDVEDDALPTLRGPDGSAAHMLAMFGRLGSAFAPMDAHLDALDLSGRGSWRVELDTGAEVEIGRGSDDEVIARTRTFVATLPELRARYQDHPLLYADLRHRDGYAVRLKGVSTAVDAGARAQKK